MKHIFVFGVSLWPKKWEILGKHHETFDYVGHYGEQKRCVFSMNVRKSRASRKSRRTCCEFPDPGSGRMELPRLSGRTERAIATLGPGFDVHVVDRGSGIPVELWPVQLFFLPPPPSPHRKVIGRRSADLVMSRKILYDGNHWIVSKYFHPLKSLSEQSCRHHKKYIF